MRAILGCKIRMLRSIISPSACEASYIILRPPGYIHLVIVLYQKTSGHFGFGNCNARLMRCLRCGELFTHKQFDNWASGGAC